MMVRNPELGTEFRFVLKESPNFIGVAKGEDALGSQVNELLIAARKRGDLGEMSVRWRVRPAGDLPR